MWLVVDFSMFRFVFQHVQINSFLVLDLDLSAAFATLVMGGNRRETLKHSGRLVSTACCT